MEDIDFYFESAEEDMKGAIEHLQRELQKVRTGKASASMFSSVTANYYGTQTPIAQMANISNADSRTLVIQPWDKGAIAPIEQAIFEANLGVTPQNDGEIIRISIPPLTEDRRKDLAKQTKSYGEDAKVVIRNARRDLMESIKKEVKDGFPEDAGKRKEEEAQKLTNNYTKKIDDICVAKEKDIFTI